MYFIGYFFIELIILFLSCYFFAYIPSWYGIALLVYGLCFSRFPNTCVVCVCVVRVCLLFQCTVPCLNGLAFYSSLHQRLISLMDTLCECPPTPPVNADGIIG